MYILDLCVNLISFEDFLDISLLLVSNLILLWSENTLSKISILKLLSLILWPNYVLYHGDFPCAFEENVHPAVTGYVSFPIRTWSRNRKTFLSQLRKLVLNTFSF